VRDSRQALQPYSAGGAYLNFMDSDEQSRVSGAYGVNYERLARLKSQYDPSNLFRLNQNIQPTV
jgi:FAD/FMN-containing dehydrogenase